MSVLGASPHGNQCRPAELSVECVTVTLLGRPHGTGGRGCVRHTDPAAWGRCAGHRTSPAGLLADVAASEVEKTLVEEKYTVRIRRCSNGWRGALEGVLVCVCVCVLHYSLFVVNHWPTVTGGAGLAWQTPPCPWSSCVTLHQIDGPAR